MMVRWAPLHISIGAGTSCLRGQKSGAQFPAAAGATPPARPHPAHQASVGRSDSERTGLIVGGVGDCKTLRPRETYQERRTEHSRHGQSKDKTEPHGPRRSGGAVAARRPRRAWRRHLKGRPRRRRTPGPLGVVKVASACRYFLRVGLRPRCALRRDCGRVRRRAGGWQYWRGACGGGTPAPRGSPLHGATGMGGRPPGDEDEAAPAGGARGAGGPCAAAPPPPTAARDRQAGGRAAAWAGGGAGRRRGTLLRPLRLQLRVL